MSRAAPHPIPVHLLALAITLACACSEPEPAPTPDRAGAAHEAEPTPNPDAPPSAKTPEATAAADLVEVAPGGSRFDPPVELSRIPVGAFVCEMGTVHYAAMERGDGKCPVCGMALKQHTPGDTPPAGDHAHH